VHKSNSQISIDTSDEASPHVRPLWRNRDFVLLWSGQTVSVLGTNISTLALPLLILALTQSPAQAGLLSATRLIPYLFFSLFAGVFIDRWNRKTVMIVCDLLRWLALGSIPLAFLLGWLNVPQLYIVAFIDGTTYVFFSLAQISSLTNVVHPVHLPRAFALSEVTESLGTLLGPGLGGLLINAAGSTVFGAAIAYLIDSTTYLVSALSLFFMRASFQLQREQAVASSEEHTQLQGLRLRESLLIGWRFLWRQRYLRLMVLLMMAFNLFLGPLTLITILLGQKQLHISVAALGLIISVGGVGALCGSIVSPWTQKYLRLGQAALLVVALIAADFVLLATAQSAWQLALGNALAWFLLPFYTVPMVVYRLRLVPDELQGRVNSAFRFLTYGIEGFGPAIAGLLLGPLGARTLLWLIAGGFVLAILFVALTDLRKA
jgi:MFS family permease